MNALGKLMGFLPTRNAGAARIFYETKLGLRFLSDDQFALVFQSGENLIRIARVEAFTPPPFTVLGWQSTHIEEDVGELAAHGIAFERFGFLPQDELGIWTAPSGDKVAWFKDPDGNTLSISQHI